VKALNLRSIRPIDAAIAGVAVAVLVLGGVLGWSIWSQNQSIEEATPLSRAISELQVMIDEDPDNIDLRMELAQAFTALSRYEEATEQYQQVLERAENHVAAISGLGFITARQQEWASSEEYWRRAIELIAGQPNGKMSKQYETANFYLGNVLLEQKRYEEAIGAFKESLRVNRSASDTYFLMAAAFRGMDLMEEYRENLELTVAFDPKMPEANYELGNLLLEEGNEADAAQHFRVAADEAPARPEPLEALERLGPVSERMDKAKLLGDEDPDEALMHARVAVAIEPRSVEALMLMGELYEKTGDDSAATDTYRAVLAIEPNNEEAQAALERVTDGT
jgi:tetratricopeptide (TPR) repeat protein